jgi:hypothetical protein
MSASFDNLAASIERAVSPSHRAPDYGRKMAEYILLNP